MPAALRLEDWAAELPKLDIGELASVAASLTDIEQKARELRTRLDALYERAKPVNPEIIQIIASAMLEMEQQHAVRLVPLIDGAGRRIHTLLRSKRSHSPGEKSYMRQQQRYADALASWLEALRDMRIKLHLLASDKMRTAAAPDVEITGDADLEAYFRSIAGR
jgi:hypothetical protein